MPQKHVSLISEGAGPVFGIHFGMLVQVDLPGHGFGDCMTQLAA